MSYLLPHLHSGWEVDQAIVTEEDRVVVIRFGRDQDATCMIQDEVLMSIAEKVKNFAKIYVVDIDEVPDFSSMYELYDPCTTMFFYRNKVRLKTALAAWMWSPATVSLFWPFFSACCVLYISFSFSIPFIPFQQQSIVI
jgi:Mitosis protein DIM1